MKTTSEKNLNDFDGIKNEHLYLFVSTLISAFVRIWLAIHIPLIEKDGITYILLAKGLMAGEYFDTYKSSLNHPLYQTIMGLLSIFTDNYILIGRAISITLGSLAIVPVYLIAKRIWGKAGIVAIFFVAFHPLLMLYSAKVMTEITFLFFILWGCYFGILIFKTNRIINVILCSTAFTLAYLTRPEGFIGLVITIAFIFFFYILRKDKKVKRFILTTVVLLITFIILASPFLIFLREKQGYWTLSGKAKTVEIQVKGKLNTKEEREYTLTEDNRNIIKFIRQQKPKEIERPKWTTEFLETNYKRFKHQFKKGIVKFLPSLIPIYILIFVLIGFLSKIRKKFLLEKLYCAAFLIAPFLFYPLVYKVNDRYLMWSVPLASIFIANGIVTVSRYLSEKLKDWKFMKISRFKKYGWEYILILLLILLIGTSKYFNEELRNRRPLEKRVASWMKENIDLPDREAIMCREPLIPFYAHQQMQIPSPLEKDFQRVLKYARIKGVKYVVIDSTVVKKKRPDFKFLLDERKKHPNLIFLISFERSGRKIVVYELK